MTASSQVATRDTSSFCLPLPVAKQIVKDILRKDSLADENRLLWKNSDILSNQIRMKDILIVGKDSIISLKNELIAAKDTTIALKDRQVQEYKGLSEKLEGQYKRQKRNGILKDASGGTIIAVLLAILILK